MIFSVFQKNWVLGILGPPYCDIGATIRIGREMLCLPYAGFLQSPRNWGLCLDITFLVRLSVRPLRRGCVILLSIKLRRMERWNYGMTE